MIANSRSSTRRRRSGVLSRFVPQLECLETREVPSVTQDPGGNVIVTGTAQADTVLVAADTPTTVRVRFNDTDYGPFILTPVNHVSVSAAAAMTRSPSRRRGER
jgi:hypothetical protein